MHVLSRLRWGAAALLLAGGCRSEQAAFSFRPAPAITNPAPATPGVVTSALPVATTTSAPLRVARPQPAHPRALARRLAGPHLVSSAHRPRHSATAAHPTRPAAARTGWHLALGAVLVVAGVVAGLILGGWLGLGVGALLVVAGYYFVLLGIGGQHAWLEIFQEFFNM